MAYIIVGLGNPGEEYAHSRHNTGRALLEGIAERRGFSPWKKDKMLQALVSKGSIGTEQVRLILPETYMNRSGLSVKKAVPSAGKAKKLIVVHDEIDLPLGSLRVVFGRGSGGHNGVTSVIRSIGTKDFIRIRVGVSPAAPKGNKARKPKGEEKVLDFLMGDFKKAEREALGDVGKRTEAALETIVEEGVVAAMNAFN